LAAKERRDHKNADMRRPDKGKSSLAWNVTRSREKQSEERRKAAELKIKNARRCLEPNIYICETGFTLQNEKDWNQGTLDN
jgi:hypothetical protein